MLVEVESSHRPSTLPLLFSYTSSPLDYIYGCAMLILILRPIEQCVSYGELSAKLTGRDSL